MTECVYCAVNSAGEIQWVYGASRKTNYFITKACVSNAVAYHNEHHPDDLWHVQRFALVPAKQEATHK